MAAAPAGPRASMLHHPDAGHGHRTASSIKVCVRVRPFASRERGEPCVVAMPTKQQVDIDGGPECTEHTEARSFVFDRAYWSHRMGDPHFATQETLMDELGNEVLSNALEGFNSCLFAYGQTGAGKTHSVLGGEGDQRGLLPRVLEGLFAKIGGAAPGGEVRYECKVSYLEVYNESIRDLLVPVDKQNKAKLEVRHHPKFGVYVPGLSESVVSNCVEVNKMIEFGQKSRSVAATSMNATSSRSHCIFTFHLEKEICSADGHSKKEGVRSRVNLVDLAGSERQAKTNATGDRLKEGAMINQSLSALAAVINKLAAAGKGGSDFVPFRNSKLTHLLQESLSGNSKTVMMAAISPALSNIEETLSTLRFAQTCKNVTTRAVVNKDITANIVEDLKAEIARLREGGAAAADPALLQRLQESEALRARLEEDREGAMREARQREEDRARALEDMGLSMQEISMNVGVDPDLPQLINMSDDPSLSGCLVYYLPVNQETRLGSDRSCKIVLQGLGILPHMCGLHNEGNHRVELRLVAADGAQLLPSDLQPRGRRAEGVARGRVLVNGRAPAAVCRDVGHKDRLILGHAHCFRLILPALGRHSVGDPASALSAGGPREGDNLEEALGEVMQEDTQEFLECRAMLDSIQDRIGESRAQDFLRAFGRALPLVEEANLITSEVRPEEQLRFQLEVCSDILTFTTDEPELVVRLYRTQEDGGEQVVDVAEMPQFVERLGGMREAYADWLADPESQQRAGPGSDPWMPCSYGEVRQLFQELMRDLEEEMLGRQRAEARVRELERQLAAARAAKPPATIHSVAKGGTLVDEKLRVAREESLATAELASKLLASLQHIAGDIRGSGGGGGAGALPTPAADRQPFEAAPISASPAPGAAPRPLQPPSPQPVAPAAPHSEWSAAAPGPPHPPVAGTSASAAPPPGDGVAAGAPKSPAEQPAPAPPDPPPDAAGDAGDDFY